MIMRSNFQLLLLLCMIAVTTRAQNDQPPSLNIGDPAPPLRVREWLKGTPVKRFHKGKVYVVEFWATWCVPCKAAMPHLSALAREYKDRITFLGIDVMERKTTSMNKIRDFVHNKGQQMDYYVAVEDSNFMVATWMEASGEQGIPSTFVVNSEGRLAWIGHPKDLSEVLRKIVNNDWNIKEASAKRTWDKTLREMDRAMNDYLNIYWDKPDLLLQEINKIVKNEPRLKYTPFMANSTFSSLLGTNKLQEAYEYGKAVLVTPTYDDPAYDEIISVIKWHLDNSNLPAEIFRLGAEAYQAQIDGFPYPELANLPKLYNNMAEWYWRANNKTKAIDAQQKAIEALKSKKDFSATDLAAFESRLQQYKNM